MGRNYETREMHEKGLVVCWGILPRKRGDSEEIA